MASRRSEVLDRGLDAQGYIRREGAPDLVQPEFANLVVAFRDRALASFGDRGLDSLYLYGSIPRGTARPGRSDLDGQVLLDRAPTDHDRDLVRRLETELDAAHAEVSGVGILLDSRAALLDPADRYDGGFHLRVLCTPLWGPDAGAEVEPHRPDLALARKVQGDWPRAIARYREEVAAPSGPATPALCRSLGRRLARIAFTWVMPRWGGWTSDPRSLREVVAAYEPAWTEPVGEAVRLGWDGAVDLSAARTLLGGFTDELMERGQELGAR